jgi:hypothetical protein
MACVLLSEALLNRAWAEVERARKKREFHKHLAEHTDTNLQPEGVSCPSQEPFGICCPCVHANISSKMDPRKGAGMLMVPANLSLNTLRELLLPLDTNNPRLGMRVLYQATLPAALKDRLIKVRPSERKSSSRISG